MNRSRILFASTLACIAGSTLIVPALWERPFAHAVPSAPPASTASAAQASPASPGVAVVPGAQAAQATSPSAPGVGVTPTAASGEAGLLTAITSAADAISPSVVQIRVEAQPQDGFPGFAPPDRVVSGEGSGFVFRADGYILTNLHVVQNATRIEVRLRDGRRFVARLVGADPAIDLAVVRVHATNLVPATFASSDAARAGQWVVAVGAPFGLDYTVTAGVLSAVGRANLGANEIEDYLQTDASINPGNSGGPLVDLQGRVLGINTMIIGRASGIGFAIPGDLARYVADQIVRDGRVHRAWIGVSFQELTPELAAYFAPTDRRGALINGVVPEGPASRAGLLEGDVILSFSGEPIADGHELLRKLLVRPVGERVALGILRGGQPQTVTLTTAERPASPSAMAPPTRATTPSRGVGLSLESLDPALRARLRYRGPGSLVVRAVVPGSAADHAGLRPGDVLVQVDRANVATVDDVRRQLSDGRALFDVARGDRRFFAVVEGGN